MAPPGRRKPMALTLVSLLVLFLLFNTASAASAVLGIDLGTEYLKAAVAKPGSPIEIVLTKDSKRKEAATLAFKPSRAQGTDAEAYPERLYGGDAVALSARYPGDVYPNLKSLLGIARYTDPVKAYTARYPGLLVESVSRFTDGNTRGTVGFKSQNLDNKKDVLMVEELLAMELKNIKSNAEAAVGKNVFVTDAVITFPAFFTAEEKRAIELAADFAGLRVLGLISDGLAVGLNYATTRVFDSVTEGARPEYHLVYDMGAGSTTATLIKFQGRTIQGPGKRNQTVQEVQVVGTGVDTTLGGDSLNDLIVKDMIIQFVELPKIKQFGLEPVHVKTHGKTMARFWKDAERLRQVLSANSMASATFEGLYYEDVTFKYSLTRDHFEKLSKSHATRVEAPLKEALEAAGATLSDVDSIILHGGMVRTPFVQKQLEAFAGGSGKIKTNVNADEAAVFGAAFKAAAISPNFRVKDIRISDISGTAVRMSWEAEGKERSQKLFTAASQVGTEKQVLIKTLEDVTLEFTQVGGTSEQKIMAVAASNLTKSASVLQSKHGCTLANITTSFTIRLNPFDGVPEVMSGSVSCTVDGHKEGSVMDNVKGLFGFGSKKADQAPLGDEADDLNESSSMTPMPVSDPTSSGSTVTEATPTETLSSAPTAASSTGKAAKATSSTVTIPLALKSTILGLNAPPTASIAKIRQRLGQFDSSDRNAVLRSEALNVLEGFTYRARDYLADESFIAVSSKQARQTLEQQVSAVSEWLYGEGTDAKLQDFKDKLKELKTLVDPVLRRKDEGGKREAAVQGLRDAFESMTGIIQMVEGGVQKAAEAAASSASSVVSIVTEAVIPTAAASLEADGDELEDDPYSAEPSSPLEAEDEPVAPKPYEYTAEDLSSISTVYDSAKQWLDQKLALQEKLGPYDDPAVLVSELEAKARDVQQAVSDTIMKTIKMQEVPKPKKKSKTAKKTKTKSKKASGSTANGTTTTTSASSSSTSGKDEL